MFKNVTKSCVVKTNPNARDNGRRAGGWAGGRGYNGGEELTSMLSVGPPAKCVFPFVAHCTRFVSTADVSFFSAVVGVRHS